MSLIALRAITLLVVARLANFLCILFIASFFASCELTVGEAVLVFSAGARSVCAGARSVCAGARSVCAGARSVCAGARLVCTGIRCDRTDDTDSLREGLVLDSDDLVRGDL